jgi:hypothetical protein
MTTARVVFILAAVAVGSVAAYAAPKSLQTTHHRMHASVPPANGVARPVPGGEGWASQCCTGWGSCWMAVPLPDGAPCYCPTYSGPIGGVACM